MLYWFIDSLRPQSTRTSGTQQWAASSSCVSSLRPSSPRTSSIYDHTIQWVQKTTQWKYNHFFFLFFPFDLLFVFTSHTTPLILILKNPQHLMVVGWFHRSFDPNVFWLFFCFLRTLPPHELWPSSQRPSRPWEVSRSLNLWVSLCFYCISFFN